MATAAFKNHMQEARASILNRLDLTDGELALVQSEAENLIDEWFHARRIREWDSCGARADAVIAVFAVALFCLDRMNQHA